MWVAVGSEERTGVGGSVSGGERVSEDGRGVGVGGEGEKGRGGGGCVGWPVLGWWVVVDVVAMS